MDRSRLRKIYKTFRHSKTNLENAQKYSPWDEMMITDKIHADSQKQLRKAIKKYIRNRKMKKILSWN